MKIPVTQEIIDQAENKRDTGTAVTTRCVLALAIQKATNNPDVRVGIIHAWSGDDEIELPSEAIKYAISFTCGRSLNPAEFDIPVDAWCI